MLVRYRKFSYLMAAFVLLAVFAFTRNAPEVEAACTPGASPFYRTLQQGMSGSDVRELQIRVAGWAADSGTSWQQYVSVDGSFGAQTKAAVKRFQAAYGLQVDGIVGSQTQAKLVSLSCSDGSTQHFSWSEFYSHDGSGFSGGKVSETKVRENVRRLMWKLEALRKKAGDKAITVNSGFRSIAHNTAVGGASSSQHMYGTAGDIQVSTKTPSQVLQIAKTCGFSGLGLYSSFVHMDSRIENPDNQISWSRWGW